MIINILMGGLIGLSVLLSGWIRAFLMLATGMRFGNSLPWLYLFIGIFIGKGVSDLMSSLEHWSFFISFLLSSLIVQSISAKYDVKTSGVYGTVATSGSMTLIGGLIGMIYRLIFL